MKNAAAYGFALCTAGRAKDALAILTKLHEKTPLKGDARVALAQALFDTFQIAEAETTLKEVPSELAGSAPAQRLLGEIALEKDKKEDAKAAVRRAYEIDSNDRRTKELMIFLGELEAESTAVEDTTPGTEIEEPKLAKPQTMKSINDTFRRAGITAAVMLVVLVVYAWRMRVNEKVATLVAAAKLERQKSDYASLQKADKLYKEAVELDGGNPNALGALAEVHAFLYGEHGVEASKQELDTWVERARDKDSPTGERFLGEALRHVYAGEPAKAEELLNKTIEKGGLDPRVFFALGVAEKALGKYQAARDALRRANELDPFQPTFAVELGDTFLLDSDVKNADFYWRKGADANPDQARAATRALIGRLLLGEDPATLKTKVDDWVAKANAVAPAHRASVLALQAQYALATGNNAAALKAIKEARGLRKNDEAIQWFTGNILLGAGIKEGVAAYEGLQKKFGPLPRLTQDIALSAARFGKPEDGEAKIKAAKEFYESPKGQAFVADLYLRAGDPAKAFPFVQKALKAEPALPEGLYAMARVHHLKKETPKALEMYTKALEAKQMYPEVYHQVANIYVDNKEFDQALANYAQAEKQYRQTSAPFAKLARLYEDVAVAVEKKGGKDAKVNADKWRAKAKRKA
ncbi:MAG: tetratricopeptide repeat protein [Deltaproteobacteria bacterium]|nr:tetratricopeptide repeat protein [Deltaproteobacteria bacterium]